MTHYIHGYSGNCGVSYEEDGIYLRTATSGQIYHCLCSGDQPDHYAAAGNKIVHIGECDIYDHAWTKFQMGDNTRLPGGDGSSVSAAGYYYLVENDGDGDGKIQWTSSQSQWTKAGEWYFDMNGLTIEATRRVFSVFADVDTHVTFTNSKATGGVTFSGTYDDHSVIWLRGAKDYTEACQSKELNMYRMNIDASEFTIKKNLITLECGTAGFYNCNIKGATTTEGGGAAVKVSDDDYNVMRCAVTMENCVVEGGKVVGGNGGNISLYLKGTLTMTDCVVKNGTVVRRAHTFKETVDGKDYVTASNTTGRGANIYAYGALTMTNCTVFGGKVEFASGAYESERYYYKNASGGSDAQFGNYGATGVFVTGAPVKTLNNCKIYGGTVTQEGVDYQTYRGGTIYVQGGSTLNLYGTLVTASPVEMCGAVLHMANGNVSLNDYMLADGTVVNTVLDGSYYYTANEQGVFSRNEEMPVSAKYGVTVHHDNSYTLTMNGGSQIIGGNATYISSAYGGGAVFIGNVNGKLIMNDTSSIYGGSANYGGNLWIRGDVQVNDTASIYDGTALHSSYIDEEADSSTGGGGNVFMTGGAEMTIDGGSVYDGHADGSNGGNFRIESGCTLNLISGSIENGDATQLYDEESGKSLNAIGGNIALYGTLRMTGGSITQSKENADSAQGNGKNIVANSSVGHIYLLGGHVNGYIHCSVANGAPTIVVGGSVDVINIDISTGHRGIYLASDGVKVELSAEDGYGLTKDANIYTWCNNAKANQVVATGADLTVHNISGWLNGNSGTYYLAQTEENKLVLKAKTEEVTAGALYNGAHKDNKIVYADAAIALNQAEADGYVVLYSGAENATVNNSITLDLNGKALTGLTVNNEAEIKLFDSTAIDYVAGDGFVTLAENQTNPFVRDFTTKGVIARNLRFVTIQEEDGKYTAHRIYLAVRSTVLYPQTSNNEVAIGYRIALRCDDTLVKYITAYGLIGTGDRSVKVPTTGYYGEGADNDNTKYIGLTYGTNTDAAEKTISGQAFLTITDGISAEDGDDVFSSAVETSLMSMVKSVDEKYDTLSDTQKGQLDDMFAAYQTIMSGWDLKNIKVPETETQD